MKSKKKKLKKQISHIQTNTHNKQKEQIYPNTQIVHVYVNEKI